MNKRLFQIDLSEALDPYVKSKVPGLQYLLVDADGPIYEYAGGWADLRRQRRMTPETTMMAYSMTKTLTAIAVLQWVERGKVGLDDAMDRHLPDTPYSGAGITVRQLLTHTSGIPNPVPLRWVHLAEEHGGFDEDAALERVLHAHPKLRFPPGRKYLYSNIGYWLLGKIVERVSGIPYVEDVRENILRRLDISPEEMDFVIPDANRHANGYLAKYSLMNLFKGFVTDRRFWGGYEGPWLRFNHHHLDGPAFGGLVGTARAFGLFLQDQLKPRSVLLAPETAHRMETRQSNGSGRPIPMTLGWHVGETQGVTYYYKEGGGGGFRGEMRLYPSKGLGSVVMVNATEFGSTRFLNRIDGLGGLVRQGDGT